MHDVATGKNPLSLLARQTRSFFTLTEIKNNKKKINKTSWN